NPRPGADGVVHRISPDAREAPALKSSLRSDLRRAELHGSSQAEDRFGNTHWHANGSAYREAQSDQSRDEGEAHAGGRDRDPSKRGEGASACEEIRGERDDYLPCEARDRVEINRYPRFQHLQPRRLNHAEAI